MFDQLYVWYLVNSHDPKLIGSIRLTQFGAGSRGVSLRYCATWLQTGFALSADLPLIDVEHLPRWPEMAVGAIDDARPDRWGEKLIRLLDKPKRLSLMEFLYFAGDDRFGALGVSTSDQQYSPRRHGPLPTLSHVQEMSEIVGMINAREPLNESQARLISTGGSIGGAKPKALFDVASEQWVIKFYNGEPVDTPVIEHASMTMAKQAGITVAHTKVLSLASENALAIKRFDRHEGQRLHCISAGTALRAVAANATSLSLGYPALAQELRRSGQIADSMNQAQAHELFRRMVFNILIDNTDDHERNHALWRDSSSATGKWHLTPAFDVLPTNSGQGRQEFLVGDQEADSSLANALSQCSQFGLNRDQAADQVNRVATVVQNWREHFHNCGVIQSDIESLSAWLDDSEIGRERKEFVIRGQSSSVKPHKPRPRNDSGKNRFS